MRIRDRFDGSSSPLAGDRQLVLRRLPAGARLKAARARVTPGADRELTASPNPVPGELRLTARSSGAAVEVDLHARLVLVAVRGSGLEGAVLQVDLGGGVWSEINDRGALAAPGDSPYQLAPEGDRFPLPGLRVARFRLSGGGPLRVTSATVESAPSSLRLAAQTPLWSLPGEIGEPREVPDFAAALAPVLERAPSVHGFLEVPLVLHSATAGRFDVDFEFELERVHRVEDSRSIRLRFDHGGLPLRREPVISLTFPGPARVTGASGRMVGGFGSSRVVFGPVGPGQAPLAQEIAPGTSCAQPFTLPEPAVADALDLPLAAADREVSARIDVLEDLDGKPGVTSLLAAPLEVRLERSRAGSPTWTSAPLPAALDFPAERLWLVIESLEGTVIWSSRPAARRETLGPELLGLQITRDGAMSWRRSILESRDGPLEALFRLRRDAAHFRMPVAFQVGNEGEEARVGLDAYAAAERVDLGLDLAELVEASNDFLAAQPSCPQGEHVRNGDFAQTPLDLQASAPALGPDPLLEAWTVTAGRVARSFSGLEIGGDPADLEQGPHGLSQVVAVSGGCDYELSFRALATAAGGLAELFWLDAEGGPLAEARLALEVAAEGHLDAPRRLHLLRRRAPEEAAQAELRFIVEEGRAALSEVSLRGVANGLLDPTFTAAAERRLDSSDLLGWQAPDGAQLGLEKTPRGSTLLVNRGREALRLHQAVALGGAPSSFALEIEGRAAAGKVQLRLAWPGDGASRGSEELTLPLSAGGRAAEGAVPAGAARAELSLELDPAASLELEKLSLRLAPRQTMPLTVVAEAPGELELRDFELLWEPREPRAAADLPGGLASPTPPGSKPGEEPCAPERKKRRAPRPGTSPAPRRVELPPLVAIAGIAERRAEQLAELGIRGVEDLAAAEPRLVARLPLVTRALARTFIERARELIDESALARS
ncbi:MAG: helix-hairpin-helix domain-containing protein [Acidobacteriota bacterium]